MIYLREANSRAFGSLGELERTTTSILTAGGAVLGQMGNGIAQDIGGILDATGECAEQLDQARVAATNRAVEYHTAIVRILTDLDLIPSELINEVWRRVSGQLERSPQPTLWRLMNPTQAVWQSATPIYQQVDPNAAVPVEEYPGSIYVSHVDLYIHGMNYAPRKEEAYNDLFLPFDKAARKFHPDAPGLNTAHVYLVSWDSKQTDEADTIIRQGFESAMGGPVTGTAPTLFAAVFWRELERRAKEVGDFLRPFMDRISEMPTRGTMTSHSLGCVVAAHVANRFRFERPEARQPLHSWWCMAGALPSNAFTSTGSYYEAPRITSDGESGVGTTIWYSYFDWLLGGAYLIANNGAPAIGTTGGLNTRHPVEDLNVSTEQQHLHRPAEGYFDRLGPVMRRLLRTDELAGSRAPKTV